MNLIMLILSGLSGVFTKVMDELLDDPALVPNNQALIYGLGTGVIMLYTAMMLYDPTMILIVGVLLLGQYLGDTIFHNSYVPYEHGCYDNPIWIYGTILMIASMVFVYLKNPEGLLVLTEFTLKNVIFFLGLFIGIAGISAEAFLSRRVELS